MLEKLAVMMVVKKITLEEKNGIASGVIDLYNTKSNYSSGNIFLNQRRIVIILLKI
jgi:hypothetical protein